MLVTENSTNHHDLEVLGTGLVHQDGLGIPPELSLLLLFVDCLGTRIAAYTAIPTALFPVRKAQPYQNNWQCYQLNNLPVHYCTIELYIPLHNQGVQKWIFLTEKSAFCVCRERRLAHTNELSVLSENKDTGN